MIISNPEKSSYHFKVYKEDSTYRVDKYLISSGFLFEIIHFKDSELAVMHGGYKSYSNSGLIEEQGEYYNGLRNRVWKIYNPDGMITDSIFFSNGTPYENHIFRNGKLVSSEKLINSEKHLLTYHGNGKIRQKYILGPNLQLRSLEEYSTNGNPLTKQEAEALRKERSAKIDSFKKEGKHIQFPEFPSGDLGLKNYINTEIKIPMRMRNRHFYPCVYAALLYFGGKGNVKNIEVTKSVNIDFDHSVSSALKRMPRWIMHGRKEFVLPLTISFGDDQADMDR